MAKATATERFWAKVDKSGDCWLWTAATQRIGYGQFGLNGRVELAHRVAYRMCVGDIPVGVELDHKCRVRNCVNPEHLRLVTRKQNNENVGARSATGVRGVHWRPAHNAWVVRVRHNGVEHYGGLFRDMAEAERAAIQLRCGLFTHNDSDRVA